MTKKQTFMIVAMCLLMALLIPAVSAEACSFCEFINISNITRGVTDHSLLTNLSADDHLQYILTDGTRPFTAKQSLGGFNLTDLLDPVAAQDAATKNYVDTVNASMHAYVDTGLPYISSGNTSIVLTSNGSYVLVDGSRPFTGNQSMGGNQLTNLITGTTGDSATNKTYVDTVNASMKTYVDSVVSNDTAPGSNGQVMYNEGGAEGANANFTFNNTTGTVTANFFVGNGSGLTGILAQGTTITINSTFTGLPGTMANVTNIGNTTDALLDFTIPQGDTGATGSAGGAGGQILYFRHANSTDPITYEGLGTVPAGAAEVDENVTIVSGSGQVLIDSYITDVGYPALTEIPAGLWRFRTFNYVNKETGITTVIFKVYNRTASGTETLLFTATSDEIDALAPTEILTSYVQVSPFRVSLNDRIVVKVYMETTSAAAIQSHFVYEGTRRTSHIQTVLETAPLTTLSFSVIAGEDLKKGQAVYISGSSGGTPVVAKADNTNATKSRIVGLMAADTASGANGVVRRAGALTSVDTRSSNTNINPLGQTWAAGDLLFATTGGGLTNVRPASGRSVKAAYSLTGSSATDVLLVYPLENPVWITAASAENVVFRAGDTAGVTRMSFRNYTNSEVAYVNSLGYASFNGSSMQSKNISDVLDPVAAQDAATKNYVDTNPGVSQSTSWQQHHHQSDGETTYFGILPGLLPQPLQVSLKYTSAGQEPSELLRYTPIQIRQGLANFGA